ncbi:MAG: hypothetical protein ACRC1R_02835 [Cetobacterium sp.]|uniref:hypothetical protein n=1 Tax=Cetobacterium sp. TaxID=2071632 RepID=UPI003F3A7587
MGNVIVVLVEGITDQISLESVIEDIFSKYKINFYLFEGDITTRTGITPSNIKKNIGDFINYEIKKKGLSGKDIKEVIHIVDTDGAFCKEEYMEIGDVKKFYYTENKIIAKNINDIKIRNEHKTLNLNALINMDKILRNVPYKIYYFSSNLEHVFHNCLNLNSETKRKLANELEDRFEENPNLFLEIINSQNIKAPGNYEESWKYLKLNNNSLKRASNLHLYFLEKKII